MREFVLRGSYYDMGRQYGEHCRRNIKLFTKVIQVMVALGERPGAEIFTPKYRYLPLVLPGFFKNRRRYRVEARKCVDTIKTYYPEGLEMLEGMADGARVHFDDLLFLNAAAESSLRCTALAASGAETATGEPILAMNADEAKGVERYEVVLDFRPDSGYRYQVCAMAGVLYYNFGMNEKGLVLMSTFLFLRNQPPEASRIPMLLYFSILNRCATVDEAKELLEALPKCDVGTVVYVGDAEKFLRMETSPMGRELEIVEDGLRWNTNFPTTQTLTPYSNIDEMDEASTLFSRNRMKRLERFYGNYRGAFDTEAMHTILSDHGDAADGTHMRSMCMHPKHTEGKQTCGSIIALPRQQTFRLYEPNPCLNEAKEYGFQMSEGLERPNPSEQTGHQRAAGPQPQAETDIGQRH
jgi:predicted choloylglycine hydrolase